MILERQYTETLFTEGLQRHPLDLDRLLKTYGRQIFERKRKEQSDTFHQLMMEKKVKREYERIDMLVNERNRTEEVVKKGHRDRRQEIRGKIQRLEAKVKRIREEIDEVRTQGIDKKAKI